MVDASPHPVVLAGPLIAIVAIAILVGGMLLLSRRHRTVRDDPALWDGRAYRCPACAQPLRAGWVMLGRGAIWSDRGAARPGLFAHIGSALPNTLSLRLRPAANMAWRCDDCRLLVVDHDKLVH